MSIHSLNGSNQTYGLYDIFGVNQASGVSGVTGISDNTTSGSAHRPTPSGGDTVSISTQARELFARKLHMMKAEDEMTEQALNLGAGGQKPAVDNGLTDEDRAAAGVPTEPEPTGLGDAKGAQGADGGSSSSESQDERQKELEAQLQSLQSQLMGIMSGPGDPETKEEKAGPVQNRLSTVKAELEALKAQKVQSAKA